MKNCLKTLKYGAVALAIATFANVATFANIASAQSSENEHVLDGTSIDLAQSSENEHVLDGTSIDWSYNANGSRMMLSFENGTAQYEWTEGSRAGRSAQDIPYRAREMRDGLYIVSWDQADRPDFITLVFDFNENTMASAGLIGYGTNEQKNLFLAGTVHNVNSAQPAEPDAINGADTAPYIRAALPLDEPRHLCIDNPGHGDAVELDAAFIVHTCKDGMWNLDQRFRWSTDDNKLEMPQYGQCLGVNDATAGALVLLKDCVSSLTNWESQGARLKLASEPSLCITMADGPSVLTPFAARFPARYLVRELSLEECSDEALERQLWSFMQPLDLDTILLPPSGSRP